MPEPNTATNGENQDEPVIFTEAQQLVFNKTIDAKFKEAFVKAEKRYRSEWEPKLAEKDATIAELKAKLEETLTKPSDGKPVPEEIVSLQFRIKEAQNTINLLEATSKTKDLEKKRLVEEKEIEHKERIAERKLSTLLSAAQSFGFYRPDQVVKLVEHQVEFDEGGNHFKILSDDGQTRMNKTLTEELSVHEFLSEFAEQNRHLVKGSNVGGAGSGEGTSSGIRGKVYTRSEIKAITADPKRYAEMRDEIFRAMRDGRVRDA